MRASVSVRRCQPLSPSSTLSRCSMAVTRDGEHPQRSLGDPPEPGTGTRSGAHSLGPRTILAPGTPGKPSCLPAGTVSVRAFPFNVGPFDTSASRATLNLEETFRTKKTRLAPTLSSEVRDRGTKAFCRPLSATRAGTPAGLAGGNEAPVPNIGPSIIPLEMFNLVRGAIRRTDKLLDAHSSIPEWSGPDRRVVRPTFSRSWTKCIEGTQELRQSGFEQGAEPSETVPGANGTLATCPGPGQHSNSEASVERGIEVKSRVETAAQRPRANEPELILCYRTPPRSSSPGNRGRRRHGVISVPSGGFLVLRQSATNTSHAVMDAGSVRKVCRAPVAQPSAARLRTPHPRDPSVSRAQLTDYHPASFPFPCRGTWD